MEHKWKKNEEGDSEQVKELDKQIRKKTERGKETIQIGTIY